MMSRGLRGASDQLNEYSKCKLASATAELCASEWYVRMWRRVRVELVPRGRIRISGYYLDDGKFIDDPQNPRCERHRRRHHDYLPRTVPTSTEAATSVWVANFNCTPTRNLRVLFSSSARSEEILMKTHRRPDGATDRAQ